MQVGVSVTIDKCEAMLTCVLFEHILKKSEYSRNQLIMLYDQFKYVLQVVATWREPPNQNRAEWYSKEKLH